MSKYHEEYSLRHKVEFRPDEFADDPRTFAHPAIRIICAPNRYGIDDEQTWHRSQTPMPNHAHLPLYIMDHSAVQTALAELDRLDAVRPYQLRLPGVPDRRHADM